MKRPLQIMLAAAMMCAAGIATLPHAQSYPSKPLRLIVGFPAGGPIDIVAHLLAVANTQRSPLLLAVPTMREQGLPSVEAINWYGVIVAARTPPEIIARRRDGLHKSLNDPDLREKLVSRGADPIPGSSEQFAAFLKEEIAKWGRILKESGTKAD